MKQLDFSKNTFLRRPIKQNGILDTPSHTKNVFLEPFKQFIYPKMAIYPKRAIIFLDLTLTTYLRQL